jgi:hypothetical protein
MDAKFIKTGIYQIPEKFICQEFATGIQVDVKIRTVGVFEIGNIPQDPLRSSQRIAPGDTQPCGETLIYLLQDLCLINYRQLVDKDTISLSILRYCTIVAVDTTEPGEITY